MTLERAHCEERLCKVKIFFDRVLLRRMRLSYDSSQDEVLLATLGLNGGVVKSRIFILLKEKYCTVEP